MANLHFHYGVMGSSKSANLIVTAYNFRKNGTQVEIIKPKRDTRSRKIKSRAVKGQTDALVLKTLSKYDPAPETKLVLVDEVQFFKPTDIDKLVHIADNRNIIVMCYGLMVDSNEKLFKTSARLVEVGAKLHRFESPCEVFGCTHLATHHLRFDAAGKVIRNGTQKCVGDKNYKSVCRKHFYELYYRFSAGEKGGR